MWGWPAGGHDETAARVAAEHAAACMCVCATALLQLHARRQSCHTSCIMSTATPRHAIVLTHEIDERQHVVADSQEVDTLTCRGEA